MADAQKMSEEIQRALPHTKCGTLRFWGVWFGRPHDNFHKIVSSEYEQDALRLHFDEGERLTAWYPQELNMDVSTFQIRLAERVLWEWFYYGRPKTEVNRFFHDFVKKGQTILGSTNVNWYTPDLKTNIHLPAVEIL